MRFFALLSFLPLCLSYICHHGPENTTDTCESSLGCLRFGQVTLSPSKPYSRRRSSLPHLTSWSQCITENSSYDFRFSTWNHIACWQPNVQVAHAYHSLILPPSLKHDPAMSEYKYIHSGHRFCCFYDYCNKPGQYKDRNFTCHSMETWPRHNCKFCYQVRDGYRQTAYFTEPVFYKYIAGCGFNNSEYRDMYQGYGYMDSGLGTQEYVPNNMSDGYELLPFRSGDTQFDGRFGTVYYGGEVRTCYSDLCNAEEIEWTSTIAQWGTESTTEQIDATETEISSTTRTVLPVTSTKKAPSFHVILKPIDLVLVIYFINK